jgi:hypothetical protein
MQRATNSLPTRETMRFAVSFIIKKESEALRNSVQSISDSFALLITMEFMYSLPTMAGTAFLTLFVVTVLGRGLGLYWLQPLTWLADAFKLMGRTAAWIGRKIGVAVVWLDWALRNVLDRLWPSIRDTCGDVWIIATAAFVIIWKLFNGVRDAVVDAYNRGLVAFPWLWELGQSVFYVLVAAAAVYACRWLPEPFVRAYLADGGARFTCRDYDCAYYARRVVSRMLHARGTISSCATARSCRRPSPGTPTSRPPLSRAVARRTINKTSYRLRLHELLREPDFQCGRRVLWLLLAVGPERGDER